jgi:hypothetical protein
MESGLIPPCHSARLFSCLTWSLKASTVCTLKWKHCLPCVNCFTNHFFPAARKHHRGTRVILCFADSRGCPTFWTPVAPWGVSGGETPPWIQADAWHAQQVAPRVGMGRYKKVMFQLRFAFLPVKGKVDSRVEAPVPELLVGRNSGDSFTRVSARADSYRAQTRCRGHQALRPAARSRKVTTVLLHYPRHRSL